MLLWNVFSELSLPFVSAFCTLTGVDALTDALSALCFSTQMPWCKSRTCTGGAEEESLFIVFLLFSAAECVGGATDWHREARFYRSILSRSGYGKSKMTCFAFKSLEYETWVTNDQPVPVVPLVHVVSIQIPIPSVPCFQTYRCGFVSEQSSSSKVSLDVTVMCHYRLFLVYCIYLSHTFFILRLGLRLMC